MTAFRKVASWTKPFLRNTCIEAALGWKMLAVISSIVKSRNAIIHICLTADVIVPLLQLSP